MYCVTFTDIEPNIEMKASSDACLDLACLTAQEYFITLGFIAFLLFFILKLCAFAIEWLFVSFNSIVYCSWSYYLFFSIMVHRPSNAFIYEMGDG